MPRSAMHPTSSFAWIAVAILLAGCGRQGDASPAPAAFGGGEGALAWQGVRACVDCARIETTLSLQWHGDERRYALVETYFADEQGMRFDESGLWSHRGTAILLEGERGERRAYRLLDDGRLQAGERGGASGDRQDILLPMGLADAF